MFELALLGVLMGLGAYVVARKPSTSPTSSSGERVVTLDDTISDSDRDAVIHAILYVSDPTQLDALAGQMATKNLSCAAYELSYRAWELRGASGPPPARPATCGSSVPAASATPALNVPGVPADVAAQACAMLDTSLDTATCSAVLTALSIETDPSKLDAFAQSLASTHPKAAGALAAKAQMIRAGTLPTPTAPGVAPPACPGLDANLTAAQCQEIVAVLVPTATDAALAHAVAQKYPADSYPLASAALSAKIAMLGSMPAAVAASAAAAAAPVAQAGALVGAPGYTHPTISDVAPMEPAIAAAASQTQKLEGTTEHVEGMATAAAAQAAGAIGMPVSEHVGTARPHGYWFVAMRPQDTPWPNTLAKLGSGGKSPEAVGELFKLNPHLWTFPGSGVIASFKPGDEVNVPGTWKDNLIRKGFKLKKD